MNIGCVLCRKSTLQSELDQVKKEIDTKVQINEREVSNVCMSCCYPHHVMSPS